MKFLVTLCLIASLATVAWTGSASYGRRLPNDYLLHRETVVRFARRNELQSANVVFPGSGQTNTRNITAIYVIDNFRNNSGGTSALWAGGPNYRFAQINLKSRYSMGFNMTVDIYGR